jgi:hypothetical protein
MARKPNYAFERNTRAKAKAEKREAKRQAKLATKTENAADETDANGADAEDGSATETPRPD